MSLIKCMECGRKISDRSRKCTYCGFPIEEYYEYLEFQKRKLNTQCSFKGTVIDFQILFQDLKTNILLMYLMICVQSLKNMKLILLIAV